MISPNQISGLPEAMQTLERLDNTEIQEVGNDEIDGIFENNIENNLEEEE